LSGIAVDSAVAAYKDLNLALVYSPNFKSTIANAQEIEGGDYDSKATFGAYEATIEKSFKKVQRAESVEAAKAAHADLIAVLDAYVRFPKSGFGSVTVDVKTIFLTPDRQQVDEVSGSASKTVFNKAFFMIGGDVAKLSAKALAQFDAALRSSQKLIAFASSKAGGGVAASSPVAAKTYHSDVDEPTYKIAQSDANFALVVGIEKYADLPQADFAERDAQAMRDHLLALGYPPRNVVLLKGDKAVRSGIEKYVESWLPSHVDENSKVFVYFSGHGAPDVKTGAAYLVPWDGDVKFLENTGYPVKRLYEKLNELKAKQVVVALDSCFSGAGGRSVIPRGLRPLVTKIDTGSAAGKLVVFAATAADEVTGSEESQGHGLFTYYFLKGLNSHHGDITAQKLYAYLKPHVQDGARLSNRDQTPQLMPADLGERASLKLAP
jgi:hypothetical protein